MCETRIAREIWIDTTKAIVWAAIAEVGKVERLSPDVDLSRLTSERKHGIGTTRHMIITSVGAEVDEKVVAWTQGGCLRLKMFASMNMPLIDSMTTDLAVHSEGTGARFEGTIVYHSSKGMGRALNAIWTRPLVTKAWGRFMAGVKYYAENNRAVDAHTELDLQAIEQIHDPADPTA